LLAGATCFVLPIHTTQTSAAFNNVDTFSCGSVLLSVDWNGGGLNNFQEFIHSEYPDVQSTCDSQHSTASNYGTIMLFVGAALVVPALIRIRGTSTVD